MMLLLCCPHRMAKAKKDFSDYIQAFEDELASFITRVEERAKARIAKAREEAEEVINIVLVYHSKQSN